MCWLSATESEEDFLCAPSEGSEFNCVDSSLSLLSQGVASFHAAQAERLSQSQQQDAACTQSRGANSEQHTHTCSEVFLLFCPPSVRCSTATVGVFLCAFREEANANANIHYWFKQHGA